MLRATAAVVLLGALSTASAQSGGAVQRCEGKDGRVTYSNAPCPQGTAPVRTVNTDPPVSVEAQKAAQERARRDAAAVQQLAQERAREQSRERALAREREKTEAQTRQRCERARVELARAQAVRAELAQRPVAAAKTARAEQDVARREADAAKACPR